MERRSAPLSESAGGASSYLPPPAPTLPDIWERFRAALHGRTTIVTYNASFDESTLERDAGLYGLAMPTPEWQCLMKRYAEYVGDYSEYWHDYRWHPLLLSTLDPLRHSPHQVAERAQSREMCGKEQPSTAQTSYRLTNGLSSVLLEHQMVERPHEQNRVERRADHRMQVSCVSHDKLHLSMQLLCLKPELALLEQGRRQIDRRDRVATFA